MISTIISVLAILFVSYSLYGFSDLIVGKLVKFFVRPGSHSSRESEKKREETLTPFFVRILRIIIVLIALFQLLIQFGIDPAPLLAAAGIVGIAVGFGAQSVVKDFFTGTLLIFENQYRVGDSVCLGDVCGDVEQITLRITRLRDADGTVHFIPHGEIKRVSNRSRGFSRINLTITVPYDTDLEVLTKVIKETGENFASDPDWQSLVNVPPYLLRIEEFSDSAVVVKIIGETAPGKSAEVSGEFRRRLKHALDAAGISVPAATTDPAPKKRA